MALSLNLKYICFILVFLTIATSCKAQDAIGIIARAALCFNNRTVLSACLATLKPNKPAATPTINITSKNYTSNYTTNTTGFCKGPCFGETMIVLNCVEGILSSFQFYSPGLMQGVMSIFGMACGGNRTAGNSTTTQRVGFSAYGDIISTSPNYGNQLLMPIPRAVWLLVLLAPLLLL